MGFAEDEMPNYRQALRLAEAWVDIYTDGMCVVVPEQTIARPYGWIFCYDSREYLRTGDESELVAGNAPILIDRINGNIRITGTGRPLDHYLTLYEKTVTPAVMQMKPEYPPPA